MAESMPYLCRHQLGAIRAPSGANFQDEPLSFKGFPADQHSVTLAGGKNRSLKVVGAPELAVAAVPSQPFGAFFVHAMESMIVLDADFQVVAANLAAQRTLGLTSDENARPFPALLTDDCRETVLRSLESTLGGVNLGGPVTLSCRRSDGNVFPATITAHRFEFDGAMLLGLVIHDQSESEAALEFHRGEQQLYETLFNLSPIALREEDFTAVASWFSRLRRQGITDLMGYLKANPGHTMDAIATIKTVRVNRAMVELMGAMTLTDLDSHRRDEMTDEVLDSFRQEFVTLYNGGTSHESEFVGLNLAGEPFECLLKLSAQSRDGELDLSRVIVAVQDVTKVRAYQRTLESLIAGKDRFVASISHELRTPLSAVMGLSQELHEMWEDFSPGEARELMGLIARGAGDLASLVEDLLLAAQPEVSDSVSATPEDFDVSEQVERAVEDCLVSGDLMVRPAIHTAPAWCRADPQRVRQIIRNLVINAARYGGDSVELRVVAEPQPAVLVLDDGPGIPVAEWDRIFDPYQQVAGIDSARGALGLGLAISKQLAEMMGGELSYHYRGGKSIFTLALRPADRSDPS